MTSLLARVRAVASVKSDHAHKQEALASTTMRRGLVGHYPWDLCKSRREALSQFVIVDWRPLSAEGETILLRVSFPEGPKARWTDVV